MVQCAVVGCKSYSNKNIKLKFFNVPAVISKNNYQYNKIPNAVELSIKRRKAWEVALKRKFPLTNNHKVCEKHFVTGKYLKDTINSLIEIWKTH